MRTRRARLSPHEVGLPQGGGTRRRRRTPGLRREEVALLADMGITWYTWLEQGRPIKMSAEALERVANALRLDPDETRHLFVLAERTPPHLHPSNGDAAEVPEGLLGLLEGLDRGITPAYVRDEHWDIMTWNRTMSTILTDYGRFAEGQRNELYMLFARLGHHGWLVDWERRARHLLACFRAIYGRHREEEARFAELIERCRGVSAEFREWWALHDVSEGWSGVVKLEHPEVGRLSFAYTTFHLAGRGEELDVVTYTPVTGSGTVERIGGIVDPLASTQPWEG